MNYQSQKIRARHYVTAELVDIVIRHGVIQSLDSPGPEPADVQSGWVAPALFDLQINGCDGCSFNSDQLTVDNVRHVVDICRKHGIGGFCPTLITNSFEAITHGLSTIRQACEKDAEIAHVVPALHLEGP